MTAEPPFRDPIVTVIAHRSGDPIAPIAGPTVDRSSPYAVGGLARGQAFVSDAKTPDGGRGSAIAPVDMMLASLGSCTAMTVLMYADRKEWPVRGIRVGLGMDRRRATPEERLAGELPGAAATGWVTAIDMTIQIDGDDLAAEQLERMHGIARKCPVHQTLSPGATIRDRLDRVEDPPRDPPR